jgi:ABC-2 type transport system permease protein
VDADTAAALERYAAVTAFDSGDALAARVAAADDVIGVTRDADGYTLLVEGNETEGLAELTVRILDKIAAEHASSLRVTWSDIADLRSPLALFGLAGVLLMAANMGGMKIGLAIIEEKEEFTLSAVNVTPVTRGQYLAGKCMIGVAIPLVQMLALPFLMGVTGVHYGKLLYITIAALSTSVVLGITIGLVSPNQIAGIAYIKFFFLAVGASFVGAIVLPEGYQAFLYWSPFYWSVRGYIDVIWGAAGWGGILLKGLWTLLLSGALLAALSG